VPQPLWVCEKRLTTDKGDPVLPRHVGLGKNCKIIRRSLPADFRKHLKSLDSWFAHLEGFRHALAHRIPLYIPPAALAEKDYPQYQFLWRRMSKASRRGNFNKYAALKAEQESLMKFQPEMIHSIADGSKKIVFHPQLLSDFTTICEIGLKMNEALDAEPATSVRRKFWKSIFGLNSAWYEFRLWVSKKIGISS
jgi:hypothetical protein